MIRFTAPLPGYPIACRRGFRNMTVRPRRPINGVDEAALVGPWGCEPGEIVMKSIHIALGAALLATSGAAAADSATDARCILLANAFAKQSKDATQQKLAEDSVYFYLGRIGGQATAAQMKALFDQQVKTITDANAGALMGECVKAVQAKVDLMQALAAQEAPPAKKPANPQGR
jgi:hypothetical protein